MSPAVASDSREPAEDSPLAKRLLIGAPLTNEELEGQAA